jgi:hypothetical protein
MIRIVSFTMGFLIISLLNGCDAIRDTIPNNATTLGDIRLDDIDDDAIEQIVRDFVSDAMEEDILVDPTENVFSVCCQYIKEVDYLEGYVIVGGQILNNSNNRYVEVVHLLDIYDNDDNVIVTERITYKGQTRYLWDFDLQPYQIYDYSVRFEYDINNISKATLTYASSVQAE